MLVVNNILKLFFNISSSQPHIGYSWDGFSHSLPLYFKFALIFADVAFCWGTREPRKKNPRGTREHSYKEYYIGVT